MTPAAQKLAQEALLEAIAARLDDLRAQQALTHADVFLRSSGAISHNTVGNVLRAHDHKISTLLVIAHALNCTLEIHIQPKQVAQDIVATLPE